MTIESFRLDAAGQLPTVVTTRNGAQFSPGDTIWSFRDSTTSIYLDFSTIPISIQLLHSAQSLLAWYAASKSVHHLKNLFGRLQHFCKTHQAANGTPVEVISAEALINYRSTLTKRTEWYFGTLVGLLRKWRELGLYGVSDSAERLFRQIKSKGNYQGEAVLTNDSKMGPYTDLEFEAIQERLNVSVDDGSISLSDYVLVMLFQLLGQRPVQYASLKLIDLHILNGGDSEDTYMLNIPRAKQRNRRTREMFRQRLLIPEFGKRVAEHVEIIKKKFAGKISPIENAPMFPAMRSLRNEPRGFEFHRTSVALSCHLKAIMSDLKIMSPRTGKSLHATPIRARRTIGTRAAAEGHGERVIAELLDHSNIHNVGIYIKARPEIVARIDRAVAMQMAPLAQAFAGKVISGDSGALRAGDSSSHIVSPHIDKSMRPMGSCGTHGFCQLAAPISCYTCVNFQPWIDGPHEAVLSFLIGERDRLLETTDCRIASINDRTIIAVAQVVQLCADAKSSRGAING